MYVKRGQFGTMKEAPLPGSLPSALFNFIDMNFKNPANTKALYFAHKLFACFETALPYEVR